MTILVFTISCGTYSYTSTNIPILAPTISIPNFKNSADFFDPDIGFFLAEALQKRFQQDENVDLIEENADILVEGKIIDYQIKSTTLLSTNSTQTNSLSIIVKLKATILNEPERNINKKFTDFVEYNANQNFTNVNDSLNLILSEKLADRIYYEMAIKW
ncbi:MAG: LPS assembly lipoprotein LptE [Bacteroidota bacterium]